jgi:hypothetical protein
VPADGQSGSRLSQFRRFEEGSFEANLRKGRADVGSNRTTASADGTNNDGTLEVCRPRRDNHHLGSDIRAAVISLTPALRAIWNVWSAVVLQAENGRDSWSAQMYSAFVGVNTSGQDGMRRAFFPFCWAVLKRLLPDLGFEERRFDCCAIS